MPPYAYPHERVQRQLRAYALQNAIRVIWNRHLGAPLGCAPKRSRFSDGSFAILYAAAVFDTAFLETVIRDQFARLSRREMGIWEIANRAWVRLDTKPGALLNLLDLRGSACVELGAPTDTVHARNPLAGQSLGRSIYREHLHIDGFLYPSRFAGTDNFAIFDRALGKLAAKETGILIDHPNVSGLLNRHSIQLLER